MKYVTWKLNWENGYGTGPEEAIVAQGINVEAGLANGKVHTGANILGYVSDVVDESSLTFWDVKNISEQKALAFCEGIAENPYLLPNGKIAFPVQSEIAAITQ